MNRNEFGFPDFALQPERAFPSAEELRRILDANGVTFRDNAVTRGLVIPPGAQRILLQLAGESNQVKQVVNAVLTAYGFDPILPTRTGQDDNQAAWYTQQKVQSPNGGSVDHEPLCAKQSNSYSPSVTTLDDFLLLKAGLFALADKIEQAKRPGYTQANVDVLRNFKESAERVGITALQAWAVHFEKHVSAIMSRAMNPAIAQAEAIEGRFVDALNYLVLGIAIISEEEPRVAQSLISQLPQLSESKN